MSSVCRGGGVKENGALGIEPCNAVHNNDE